MIRIHLPMRESQETWVRSLGQEDPLEEEKQPTPIFLPGESHGQRSLVGYNPWSHKESDMTEVMTEDDWHPSLKLSSLTSECRIVASALSCEF